MKISLITENFFKGGMDTVIVELCNHWPNPDDELTIFCNESHPGIATYKAKITRPVTVVAHSWPVFATAQARIPRKWWRKFLIPFLKYGLLAYHILKFRRVIKDSGCEAVLVVNGGYPGGDSCRAAAIAGMLHTGRGSVVCNVHNLACPSPRALYWLEYFVDRLVAASCKTMLVVSDAVRQSFSARPGIEGRCPVEVVYNGLAPLQRCGPDAKNLFAIHSGEQYLLMLCTYEKRKGHEYIIRAFQQIHKVHKGVPLVFCGYGSQEEMQQAASHITEDVKPHIHLLPFLPEPGNLLSGAYLLLSGSQEFESFGLTIIEAGCLGVPAVVTDVGGMPEVVLDEVTGYVADHRDPDAFARRVCALLENPGLRQQMGLAAQARAQTFTPDRMAAQYAEAVHAPRRWRPKL